MYYLPMEKLVDIVVLLLLQLSHCVGYTQVHKHTEVWDKSILRNQACTGVPGLKNYPKDLVTQHIMPLTLL